MATVIPQLFNSQDFAVVAELLYRRTGLLIRPEQVTLVLTAMPGTEAVTDGFIGYGDNATLSFSPRVGNVRIDSGLTVTTLRQTLNGVTTVLDPSSYSISNGTAIVFTVAPVKTARLHGDFTAIPLAYLTLSSVAQMPDLSRGPFVGTVRLELDRIGVEGQVPAILVYSDAFPPTADALITYMQTRFDFHMTDNEFFIVSDASHTPIARGGGQIEAALNADRQFQLEATNQSIRWQPGSRITMQQQSLQSIVPEGFFAFIGAPVNGSLGEPYNYTFQTVNGVEPITYSVISGIPPCPINPATGAMHADQLNSLASYSWVIEATDAVGNLTTKNCIMRVEITQLSMFPDSNTPVWTVGVPQALNFNPYGGQRPFHYAVTAGALPSGLSIVGDGLQGIMEGNPSPSNTTLQQIFTILATDNQGQTATMNFNASINDRSDTAVRASLNAKVVSWWEASYDLYPSGVLNDGDLLYDCAGRLNLTVNALTTGATITLTPTGRAGSPYAFVFDASQDSTAAVAQALSTAHGLTNDFTYVGVVNVPSTTDVIEGQVLMGQGGTALGGTSLNVGPGGNTLSVAVDVSGTPTVTDFSTTLPVGVGNWSFINALRYQGTPTLILNSGSTENGSPATGAITGNATQYFTLGSDPTLNPSTVFNGGLGMASVYQSKLWSDERKWLWNNGALRAFPELGFWPTLTISVDSPITTIPLNKAFERTFTIAGGRAAYINVGWAPGSQVPPGLTLSYDGDVTVTMAGPANTEGTYSFTVQAVSTDDQVAKVEFDNISVTGDHVVLMYSNGHVVRANPGLTSWDVDVILSESGYLGGQYAQVNDTVIMGLHGTSQIVLSLDRGKTWNIIATNCPVSAGGGDVASDGTTFYLTCGVNTVYHSTSGLGSSWMASIDRARANAITVLPDGRSTVLSIYDNTGFYSDNGGVNWTAGGGVGYVTGRLLLLSDDNIAIAFVTQSTGYANLLFWSTDGTSWNASGYTGLPHDSGDPNTYTPVALACIPNTLYVALVGTGTAAVSSNGKTWAEPAWSPLPANCYLIGMSDKVLIGGPNGYLKYVVDETVLHDVASNPYAGMGGYSVVGGAVIKS